MAGRFGSPIHPLGGGRYGSPIYTPLVPVLAISDIDGDEVVYDGQAGVAVSGAVMGAVTDAWLTDGTIQTAQAFTGLSSSGLTITAITRGNLPYSDANHSHSLVLDDGENTASLALQLTPPPGFITYPVLLSTFLTTPESVGRLFTGSVEDHAQIKYPSSYDDAGTPRALTWATDGSGNATGVLLDMEEPETVDPFSIVLPLEYWGPSSSPNWIAFNINLRDLVVKVFPLFMGNNF